MLFRMVSLSLDRNYIVTVVWWNLSTRKWRLLWFLCSIQENKKGIFLVSQYSESSLTLLDITNQKSSSAHEWHVNWQSNYRMASMKWVSRELLWHLVWQRWIEQRHRMNEWGAISGARTVLHKTNTTTAVRSAIIIISIAVGNVKLQIDIDT